MSQRVININIGKLTLNGFESLNQAELGEAIRMHLTNIMRENSFTEYSRNQSIGIVQGHGFSYTGNNNAYTLGGQIATSVHRSLTIRK